MHKYMLNSIIYCGSLCQVLALHEGRYIHILSKCLVLLKIHIYTTFYENSIYPNLSFPSPV